MPVLPRRTTKFSVDQAAIYPLLTDVAGSAPTYGSKIDIPGIKTMGFSPVILYKEAFGDNGIVGARSKVRSVKSKVGYAYEDLNTIKGLLGGTITEAGTTPNQSTTWDLAISDSIPPFKMVGRVKGVEIPAAAGGGDLQIVFWKCTVSTFDDNDNEEDFSAPGFEVTAFFTNGTGRKAVSKVLNETEVVLV